MTPAAQIITPPSRLRDSVIVGAGPDMATIEARVQAGLKDLQREFENCLPGDLRSLGDALTRLESSEGGESDQARCIMAIYQIAHDLRGLAGSLGYPLLTEIAQSLCSFIDDAGDRMAVRADIVGLHISAMNIVVADNITGDGGPQGHDLIDGIAAVIKKVKPGAP